MRERDPRWSGVSGGIVYDETYERRRLEIRVRRGPHVVGHVYMLTDDHPAELPYALDKIVRAIDEALHA